MVVVLELHPFTICGEIQTHLSRIFGVFSIILLASCSTMNITYSDPSFNDKSLIEGEIIFGGLVSHKEIWNEEDISKYSSTAITSLSHAREDLTFRHYQDVIDDTEKEEFNTILEDIRNANKLERDQLETVVKATGDFRYIIFSRLQSDEVEQYQDESQDDKKNYATVYTTKRSTVFYIEIYDLDSYQIVWSGDIKQEETNENRFYHNYNSNFLIETITRIAEGLFESYPEPPQLNTLIEHAFSHVAYNLPAKTCDELGFLECLKKAIRQ